MLDKDKLILVCRFGVKGLDLETYLEASKSLSEIFDESVKVIMVLDKTRKSFDVSFETVSAADYTAEDILRIMEEAENTIKKLKEKQ